MIEMRRNLGVNIFSENSEAYNTWNQVSLRDRGDYRATYTFNERTYDVLDIKEHYESFNSLVRLRNLALAILVTILSVGFALAHPIVRQWFTGRQVAVILHQIFDGEKGAVIAELCEGRLSFSENVQACRERLEPFLGDRDVALAAVSQEGAFLEIFNDEIKNDRAIALEAVKQDGMALEHVSDSLKKDRDVVLAAVRREGLALRFADDEFKKDQHIVLEALQENGLAIRYVDADLKRNKEIVLAAVRRNGNALSYAPDDLKRNKEIVLAAVRRNGNALSYAHDDLKGDEEIVFAAVQGYGGALQYASDDLKRNERIVLAAVEEDGSAFQYASEDLKRNERIVLAAVEKNGSALRFADPNLRGNEGFVFRAVLQSPNVKAFKFASSDLQSNKKLVIEIIRKGTTAHAAILQHVAPELKRDKEVVLAAVHKCSGALRYAPREFWCDKEVLLAAFRSCRGREEELFDFNCAYIRDTQIEVAPGEIRTFASLEEFKNYFISKKEL